MQNKFKFSCVFLVAGIFCLVAAPDCRATTVYEEELIEENVNADVDLSAARNASADAVADYEVAGSLFEQITSLEQEKVLMQLEKERAQLDLELDKLAAEKIKLHMEIDTLSGRAEQQQQVLETEKAKLEAEAARLAREKENMENAETTVVHNSVVAMPETSTKKSSTISADYKLVNVFGVGNQLQATVADLATGQNKKLSVGKNLDGYIVKSISLDDGVVFEKDGVIENLNVSNSK